MSVIDVLDGGMLTTVQDLGRTGYQKYGVPGSGAMDRFALRVANRLAGNDEGAAGAELTLQGPELHFPAGVVLALTGADLAPRLNGRPMPAWRTIVAPAGSTLECGAARDGLRAYLAFRGGIDVPEVLGSRSTFTRSGFGGFKGRPLRAGDRLSTCDASVGSASILGIPFARIPRYGHDHRLRVVLGPQDDGFTDAGVATFLSSAYELTAQSDRIGCRFTGPPVQHRTGADIVSDGIVCGAVQVSGDQMPIVLMADCGTTGGYTKIATVVSVDLGILAQAVPGDRVRFVAVGIDEAVEAIREQERWIAAIRADDPTRSAGAGEPIYDEDAAGPLLAETLGDLADALRATEQPRREPPASGRA
jgi:antagonist of KipI